jgi:hypothetical protein
LCRAVAVPDQSSLISIFLETEAPTGGSPDSTGIVAASLMDREVRITAVGIKYFAVPIDSSRVA